MDIIGPYLLLHEVYDIDDEDSGYVIDDAIRAEISAMDHVIGTDQTRAEYAIVMGLETVKDHTGVDPDPDPSLYDYITGLRLDSVSLELHWDVSLAEDLRWGDSVLLEGVCPDAEHPGLLIEASFAALNGLSLGDEIWLDSGDGQQVAGTVVGIYETQGTFEITEDDTVGEGVYAWSPYNKIYASLDFGESLYGSGRYLGHRRGGPYGRLPYPGAPCPYRTRSPDRDAADGL